jgi:hypothetical protein
MQADKMPRKSIVKAGSTRAASTAADPLAHNKGSRFFILAIAQFILIQLVMLMEVQPRAPITLTPNNG